MTNQSFDAVRDVVAKAFRDNWKFFLIEGIILAFLGMLAAAVPPVAGLAITIILGWLVLISGLIGLVNTFYMHRAPGFWWSLLSAALAIVVGGLLLAQPTMGLVSLTYILIAFLIIEGVATIMFALEHRRQLTGRWGWMLASGIVDLFLALLVLGGLPGSVDWALGLIIGINMVFGGASMVGMALAARSQMP